MCSVSGFIAFYFSTNQAHPGKLRKTILTFITVESIGVTLAMILGPTDVLAAPSTFVLRACTCVENSVRKHRPKKGRSGVELPNKEIKGTQIILP
jgi:hypothetical protein